MPMDQVECVIVGAGVVGLAIARRLARAGREVIVVEAAEGIGTGTSSRNSEVIHAGIYYAAGSLMARMCVSGKAALYAYCRDHDIPHRNCGKLIVATRPEEVDKLQSIKARAGKAERRRRHAIPERQGGLCAGASARLSGGAVVALDRDH
jgi:Predicted dehydrogenase